MYGYNPQISIDRINRQINELEQMKSQIPQTPMQPTNLTQNFQLSNNTSSNFKLVNDINDVKKTIVFNDTIFIKNDYSTLWFKNVNNTIRTFLLSEVVEKDEKDLLIEQLQNEINNLKGGENNEQYDEDGNKLLSSTTPTTKTANRTGSKVGKSVERK